MTNEDNEPERKCLNMIWANEAGVSVYIYEAEHERRTIEIHGVVSDYETVLATATIEKHNRDRFAEAFARVHSPAGKVSEGDRELVEAVAMPWICVEEKPCEETVTVHWEEMLTSLTAALATVRKEATEQDPTQ